MSQGNMGMASQGMGSQGMGSSGGMPQPTSMGAGPMGGMSDAASPSPVIYSGQHTGPNVQPSGRPLFPYGGPQMQDSYQGLLIFFTKVNIFWEGHKNMTRSPNCF
jgi:hypothetical protein